MTPTHRMIIGATLCMALGFAGCASTGSSTFPYKNYTVLCIECWPAAR